MTPCCAISTPSTPSPSSTPNHFLNVPLHPALVNHRQALLQAAVAALESHRFADMAGLCRPLVRQDANDIDAVFLFALARGAQGDAAGAAPLLNQVARARPCQPLPCADLAAILAQIGASDRIGAQYAACLADAPDDARLRRAVACHLHTAGEALAEAGDLAAAIAQFRQSLSLSDPSAQSATWSNLGALLSIQGDHDAALAAHQNAIAGRPDDAQLRVNRVVALLRAGRYTEAWADYEWRLRLPRGTDFPNALLLPDLGPPGSPRSVNLAGRTILLTHEEGFGDSIQFARFIPLLIAGGANVLVAAPGPLRRLLAGVHGVNLLLEATAHPPIDFVCPFVSLPRAFGTTLTTIPPAAYLKPNPTPAARVGPLRVGLVWAGQARPWLPGFDTVDRRRSTTLATLAPLAALPGITFVSLQKGPAAEAAASWPQLQAPLFETADFADTAAIIATLDLVISVDTAVVHLAGSLGKPVFLLDRADNCWRWLSHRNDSPWYPGLQIFRQKRIGNWAPVITDVATALARFRDAAGAMVSP